MARNWMSGGGPVKGAATHVLNRRAARPEFHMAQTEFLSVGKKFTIDDNSWQSFMDLMGMNFWSTPEGHVPERQSDVIYRSHKFFPEISAQRVEIRMSAPPQWPAAAVMSHFCTVARNVEDYIAKFGTVAGFR